MSKLELAALDAVCCAEDEARPRAAVTARAWGLGFQFDRQDGFVSSVPNPSGASLAKLSVSPARVIACAVPVSPPAGVSLRQPAHLSADVCVPAVGASRRMELCVWCALERALSGQGSAPRVNGDVWLKPCARHEERPEIQRSNPNAGVVPAYPRGRWG